MLTQIFHVLFSVLNGVKIKIMHNIVPINLHLSINVSWCADVCLILTDPEIVNLFLETSL